MPVGIFIALFGYLLGSVPTGIVLTRLFSKADPRQSGSKNIGATNIYRTSGKILGILTLIGDMLKGSIPIWMAIMWAQHDWRGIPDFWIAVVGLSPIVGHIFPIFLGFKGGKGVATGVGVYLAIAPFSVLTTLLLWGLIVYLTRYVSLGSIIATAAVPFWTLLYYGLLLPSPHLLGLIIVAVAGCALIVAKHHDNIRRLWKGTENKIGSRVGPTSHSPAS